MIHARQMTDQRRAMRALAAFAFASLAFGAAHAHQVWLEQDDKGAKLYFGEFGGNLREVSPGLLDKFVKPEARRITPKGAEALALGKTPNGFALNGRAASGESIVAEENTYPVSERKDGDKTLRSLYVPAARLITDAGKQAATLTLDLVPTGQGGAGTLQVQAVFKDKPLPKAKVSVSTAAGWSQEFHTDEQGRFTVSLPWQGTYVVEVIHADATPGLRGKDAFDKATYVTSLTVVQATGLPALPALPAAPPNK